MIRPVLILLLIFVFVSSPAQNLDSLISGYWSGELTQAEGGFIPSYIFEMYININGEEVTGQAIVSTNDTLTATMNFSGTIHKGGYLSLKETDIIEGSKMTTYEWCLKQYSLYIKPKEDDYYLVGFWTGVSKSSTCVPGKIKLKRRRNRA